MKFAAIGSKHFLQHSINFPGIHGYQILGLAFYPKSVPKIGLGEHLCTSRGDNPGKIFAASLLQIAQKAPGNTWLNSQVDQRRIGTSCTTHENHLNIYLIKLKSKIEISWISASRHAATMRFDVPGRKLVALSDSAASLPKKEIFSNFS